MKGRESGMPDAAYWNSFFDATAIISELRCALDGNESIVEFGSGYGTFLLAAAHATRGEVLGFDIELELIQQLRATAAQLHLDNLRVEQRDFVSHGTGLADASVDHAMLYNILHIENPIALLREAQRILRPHGTASVIHWRSDIATPRGPSMAIRPDAATCIAWAREAGFRNAECIDISRHAPYHFGLILRH